MQLMQAKRTVVCRVITDDTRKEDTMQLSAGRGAGFMGMMLWERDVLRWCWRCCRYSV